MKEIFQQIRKKYFLYAFCLVLVGCDQFDRRLTILNNSSTTIFYELSENGIIQKSPVVMDSLKRDTLWDHMDYIKAKDSVKIPLMGRNQWGSIFITIIRIVC